MACEHWAFSNSSLCQNYYLLTEKRFQKLYQTLNCHDKLSHYLHLQCAIAEIWSYDVIGHESWVLSVACHPSGSSFATGSSDAKVKLWDLQTRTCAQTLSDHTDQVSILPSRL